MAVVDPQLNQIPHKLLNDPELRVYFENLERFRHDSWVKSGGGSDAIADADIAEKYPWPTNQLASETKEFNIQWPTNQLASEVDQFKYIVTPGQISHEYRAVTSIQDYTAVPFDFVNAKQGSTITLPQYPIENSVIIIRNGDGSVIKLDGNGKNINGSSSGILRREETTVELYYFIDSDEWLAK